MSPGDNTHLHGPPTSRARARVAVAFAAFALGLTLAKGTPQIGSTVWFSIATGLCGVALIFRGWTCRVALALCVGFLAAGWFAVRLYQAPTNSLELLLARETTDHQRPLITIDGVVLTEPRDVPRPTAGLARFEVFQPRTRLDVDAQQVISDRGPVPVRDKLWVRISQVKGEPSDVGVHAGDHVCLTGLFAPVDRPMNPGEEDMAMYAAEVGYAGSLTLSNPSLIEPADDEGAAARARRWWLRGRAAVEGRARDIVTRAGGTGPDDPSRGLLQGLILGDFDPANQEVRSAFAR